MSGKIYRGRGNKNDEEHVAQRRELVAKIIRNMMDEDRIPIRKELILEQLGKFGYNTSKRTLERDIASIFGNDVSAVFSYDVHYKKVNPGTKYMKLISDECNNKNNEDMAKILFRQGISPRAARKDRAEKLASMLAVLNSTLGPIDDEPNYVL
jgi:hypothetical protein